MCGIVGVIGSFDNPLGLLTSMQNCLSHRGPDQEGVYIDHAKKVYFAHRRLAILDLSEQGRQPMISDRAVIVLNGEIYNYKILRKELSTDYTFSSASDTEVLLHGYDKWGIEKLLSKIKGMFVFAIFDKKNGKVYLCRDRMGEKPLYCFSNPNKGFAFASEMKAFKRIKEARQINPIALDLYFTLGYIPAPLCIIENCFKLQPGHYLSFDLNNYAYDIRRYWHFDGKVTALDRISELDAKEKVYQLLSNSVGISMFSDVPIGVFLSGGLDSSLICAMALQQQKVIKTFSVAYDDPSFDESYYSRIIAKYLGTDHTELHISSDEVKQSVLNLHKIIDEPMSDMSIVPTQILSQKAREHVTVALGGDGADEMFCGYPTQLAHKVAEFYTLIPSYFRKQCIEKLIERLPVSNKDFSVEFRLKRFVASAEIEPTLRHFLWQAHIPLTERFNMYHSPIDSNEILNNYLRGNVLKNSKSVFKNIEHCDLSFYLPNDILSKVDIAAMSCSLETRSPFLDFELVEFAYGLPEKLKFRVFNQKYILKKISERFLPKEIIYRKKHGFGVPIGRWLKDELFNHTKDLLTSGILEKAFHLNRDYVDKLLLEHKNGQKDNRKQIWSLTVLANWMISYGYT